MSLGFYPHIYTIFHHDCFCVVSVLKSWFVHFSERSSHWKAVNCSEKYETDGKLPSLLWSLVIYSKKVQLLKLSVLHLTLHRMSNKPFWVYGMRQNVKVLSQKLTIKTEDSLDFWTCHRLPFGKTIIDIAWSKCENGYATLSY